MLVSAIERSWTSMNVTTLLSVHCARRTLVVQQLKPKVCPWSGYDPGGGSARQYDRCSGRRALPTDLVDERSAPTGSHVAPSGKPGSTRLITFAELDGVFPAVSRKFCSGENRREVGVPAAGGIRRTSDGIANVAHNEEAGQPLKADLLLGCSAVHSA
jgi:hypothetical protein